MLVDAVEKCFDMLAGRQVSKLAKQNISHTADLEMRTSHTLLIWNQTQLNTALQKKALAERIEKYVADLREVAE